MARGSLREKIAASVTIPVIKLLGASGTQSAGSLSGRRWIRSTALIAVLTAVIVRAAPRLLNISVINAGI